MKFVMKLILRAMAFAAVLAIQPGTPALAQFCNLPVDGDPAAWASLNLAGIALREGNLYLTDGARIRKVSPNGIVTTVAGLVDPVTHQAVPGYSGDGGPALSAQFRSVTSLEFDTAGNLYLADEGNNCVRKITARVVGGVSQPLNGTETVKDLAGICTIVGNLNGVATSALFNAPHGLAFDSATGALYITDVNNNNVRKVDPAGSVTTIAGTGTAGFAVDGEPAVNAQLNLPTGVTLDPGTGDLYIAEVLNNRVRKVSGGIITTVAGTGTSSSTGGLNEGGAAVAANVTPVRVRFAGGKLYILDTGVGMVRQVSGGIITTLAGSGLPTYSGPFPPVGDGGPALSALLGSGPHGSQDIVLDASGGIFIADASTRRVRFAANIAETVFGQSVAAGIITTVAGPGIVSCPNVSSQISITQNGFARNRATGYWVTTLTVKNIGTSAITGPVQLLFSNLSSNATLVDGTGSFAGLGPFTTVSGGSLSPGASASTVVQFANPSNQFITYAPVIYSFALP